MWEANVVAADAVVEMNWKLQVSPDQGDLISVMCFAAGINIQFLLHYHVAELVWH